MEGLILQAISSGYGDDIVIKDLFLSIGQQETVVLMGMSGAGKTTLLKTILGILLPKKGKILLQGKDITNIPIEQRNIGYLSHDYGLFPHLTVAENIAYGLRVRDVAQEDQRAMVKKMLDLMQMVEFAQKSVNDLSAGQRQRVGLARALAIKPALLLLDEPLTNIDQITKLEVAQELKKLFGSLGIPVIIVTHQYEDARFLGKRIAIMMNGSIKQSGTYDEIVQNPQSPEVKKLLVPFFEH